MSDRHKPPFENCRFQLCDLPGQCRSEGKCHHPTDGGRQSETERKLRALLAINYSGAKLYGDDGELSDSSVMPFIDFLRDTPDEIERNIIERSRNRLAEETEKYSRMVALECLISAAKSGDKGAIELAAQITGYAPCPTCLYVKQKCRCPKQDGVETQPGAVGFEGADAWNAQQDTQKPSQTMQLANKLTGAKTCQFPDCNYPIDGCIGECHLRAL